LKKVTGKTPCPASPHSALELLADKQKERLYGLYVAQITHSRLSKKHAKELGWPDLGFNRRQFEERARRRVMLANILEADIKSKTAKKVFR
jgi:hypothetical protein